MPCQYELKITRTFNTSIETLFHMWTDSNHLKKWWVPNGFTMDVARIDLSPNGILLYKRTSSEGQEMWGKFVYQEIVEPTKLVFINSFSDEKGQTVRAPFYSSWPLEILNTLTFKNENEGRTNLTIQGIPVTISEEELETFRREHEGIKEVFSNTFDQLDTYLKKAGY